MRITLLKNNPEIYSCNVYLIRGKWNSLNDVNTLIDTGTNGYIMNEISTISTGAGKNPVEQVILTHEHFDHAGGLIAINKRYNPIIYSRSNIKGSDMKIYDGMTVKIGDAMAKVLYTPGHSNDSICVYCQEEQVLFSGDTPVNIKTAGGTYNSYFLDVLKRLSKLKIKSIYPGHESPYHENVQSMIKTSLNNVLKSKIIK